METSSSEFPDLQTLIFGLMCAFTRNGRGSGEVTVLDRRLAEYSSTFPTEVVACRLDDGTERRLLCKYAAEHVHEVYKHKGGGRYEARVYAQVLRPLEMSTPAFYGTFFDPTTSKTWLILEYVERSLWVNKACEESAMTLAASWIGRFHSAAQARLVVDLIPFLHRYDSDYYLGWVRRTLMFAAGMHEKFPWLANLCAHAEELLALLWEAPQTIIHGEYYPENVLFSSGIIYPVDWESAAIGPGEIDLAALTEGWPSKFASECEFEYKRARWPRSAPAHFQRILDAARLYLHFRWLGDRPEWTADEKCFWHFECLRALSVHLMGD